MSSYERKKISWGDGTDAVEVSFPWSGMTILGVSTGEDLEFRITPDGTELWEHGPAA